MRLATTAGVTLALLLSAALDAQWLEHPTPGIPRLPDGKPNLSAPAPRTADGKPDIYICNENNRYFEILPKK